jgi:hypothetical protein
MARAPITAVQVWGTVNLAEALIILIYFTPKSSAMALVANDGVS